MPPKKPGQRPEFSNSGEVETAVESVVAKYSLRNLRTMIVLAFFAGCAFATFQFQLWKMSQSNLERDRELLTIKNYDMAVYIFNSGHPQVLFPYYHELTRSR